MPIAVMEEMRLRLQGRRNAEAVYALAVHLARCHAGSRLTEAFAASGRGFDRTGGLVEVEDLGLSEKQIRNALLALEAVGFLVRDIPRGNGWQATSAGVRKAPIRYRFGPDFFPLFQAAKATKRRGKADFTKGRRCSDFVARKIDLRPVSSELDQTLSAPLSPKGFARGREPLPVAPDPQKAAALAELARLKAAREPVPMLSPALLAALGRNRK